LTLRILHLDPDQALLKVLLVYGSSLCLEFGKGCQTILQERLHDYHWLENNIILHFNI
jgi:hypothetical protein